jgi:FkbM family methyltransferase
VKLAVPGHRRQVWAREDTSDRAAFDEVFGGAYDVSLAEPPELVLDLGANVGYAAVAFALRWPDAHVVAVEPEPANVRLLRRNVEGLDVEVVEAAVWPHEARLELEDPGKGRWAFRVDESSAGSVRAATVPQLLAGRTAGLVKMDVEGSELAIFSGDTGWLEAVDVLAIELHDRYRPGCRDAVVGALERAWPGFVEERLGDTVVFRRNDDGPPGGGPSVDPVER